MNRVFHESQKAIIISSKLQNKFFGDRTKSNKKAYSKQKNIFVNNLCKSKRKYYSNVEVSKVADNKKFWKTVNNFFSDRSNNFETITLVGNNIVISDDQISEFSFFSMSLSNLQNELRSSDSRNSMHETNISTKKLKESMDIFSTFLRNYFNSIIDFLKFLKPVEIKKF